MNNIQMKVTNHSTEDIIILLSEEDASRSNMSSAENILSEESVNHDSNNIPLPEMFSTSEEQSTCVVLEKRRKKKVPRALSQIKKMQKSTNLLIPKKSFGRLVREIAQELGDDLRFQEDALLALQEAAEAHLIEVFKRANTNAIHARRLGINASDWKMAMNS